VNSPDDTTSWSSLSACLAAAPDPVAALREDQLARWAAGDRVAAEEYLRRFPALRPEDALALVVAEVGLRRERGESPTLAEYQGRFPDLAEALRLRWEADGEPVAPLVSTVQYSAAGHTPGAPPAVTFPISGHAAKPARGPRGAGQRIGRYQIQSILGKGGMGVAYRAWDPDLKRVVAVKTLRTSDADESELARFRTESEAIARVRHPNIVQVFDVGEEDGQPFFAMEFCAGGSLAARLNGSPLPPDEAAAVVEQVARGVQAAHAQNIIHRDLKPANVLLSHDTAVPGARTSTATVPAPTTVAEGGTPHTPAPSGPVVCKVTDFGLAKALDADDGQTRTGAVLGTPSYMAPEQAFGRASKVGPAADVYALGAMLYECLTGRPPFRGATMADTLEQVRHREPVAVRQLQPKVPADLETIALKCLQKEAGKRYATAAEVADDLRRYLDRRPILARPIGPVRRTWRWCRRNPAVAGLLFGVFLALALGTTGTAVMWSRAVDERNQARENYERSERYRDAAEVSQHEEFQAVNDAFIRISEDRLLNQPHMLELRKDLLAAAQPYFQSFVARRRDDPRWRRELAVARARLAFVAQVLESLDDANARWREVIPLWEQILRDNPDSPEGHIELAKVHVSLGYQEHKGRRAADAERELNTAIAHVRAVPGRESRDYELASIHAIALAYLANIAGTRGEAARAGELHRESLRVQEDAARRHPGPPAQLDLGQIHFLRGKALLETWECDAAAAEFAAAAKVFGELANTPCREQVMARRNLASTLALLGLAQWKSRAVPPQQAVPRAEKTLLQAKALWEKICDQYPSTVGYQISLADTQHHLAQLGLDTNRVDAGEKLAQATLELRLKLIALDPKNPLLGADIAESYFQLREAARLRLNAAPDDATADRLAAVLAERSGTELDYLVKHHRDPGFPPNLVERIYQASRGRARLLVQMERFDDARKEWDRCIEFAPPELKEQFRKERQAVPAGPKKG
jgi:serine/threonine-protein kinase